MNQMIDIEDSPLKYREDNTCPIGMLRLFHGEGNIYDIEFCSEDIFFWGKLTKTGFYFDIVDDIEGLRSQTELVANSGEWIDDNGWKCLLEIYKSKEKYFIIYRHKGFYAIYENGE